MSNKCDINSYGQIWMKEFGADDAKIGQVLLIRLPADYRVTASPSLSVVEVPPVAPPPVAPPLTGPTVAALGAAAVLVKNPVISRRFWSK